MAVAAQTDPAFTGEAPLPGEVVTGGATWPRMLKLDEETKNRLVDYLDYELMLSFQERQLLVEDWMDWQTDYWAKPESKEKNFPFKRAANVVIPLTAIAVEAIYARLMNTLFSVEPFWSIRPKTKDWIEASPSVESWLQTEAVQQLDVFKFCQNAILELVKLGTAVGKSGYERVVKKKVVTLKSADGTTREIDTWIETRNGATLDHVPLANFLIRLHEMDPQTASWVGEEHEFVWSQLKRMALSGQYRPEAIEEIKTYWTDQTPIYSAGAEYEDKIRELSDSEPAWHQVFRVQELWLSFDVDGDGIDEEIVVDFHKESHTILAIRYNWYDDLHRPYRVGVYIPVENRLYGIGVGKQNEQFQKLITTIHRQRLDNATLANMFQLAIKKTSGYGTGEKLWPGKMWFLDDPSKDIRELKLSDTYQSTMQNEEYATRWSEKRSGANEMIIGAPQEGTPGTATSDMARLAEGNKKFDLVLKNIRRFAGPLGVDVLANYQQFGDQDRHWLISGPEKGQYVEMVLQMPPTMVRQGALIELTVTDSITNKEIQRQEWMGLYSILTQSYDRQLTSAFQLLQVVQDPNIVPIVASIAYSSLKATDYATRRLVETFKEANINIDALLLVPSMQEMLNAQNGGSAGGQAQGLNGAAQTPGMGELSMAFGSGGGSQNPGIALSG